MNSSQMPAEPSERIGCSRPSQELKSPTTLTDRAFGAQTANATPGDAVDLPHVRAELRVELLVAALAGEVQVELAERRQERVRVAQRECPALGVGDLELVAQRQLRAGDRALEHAARVAQLELDRRAALRARDDRRGVRAERADDDAAVRRVGAEQAVRLGEVAVDDRLDVGVSLTVMAAAPPAVARSRPPGSAPSRGGC